MNVSVSGWNLCCVCEEVLLNDIYTNEECFDLLELSSLWLVNYVSILMEKQISGWQCQVRHRKLTTLKKYL